jgi:hypothetical protein
MHARSKLIESDDISFYSQSTLKAAQMSLRESSEDSNGERENDALTKALQTKEQRGRARGLSSKLTMKEGFSEHKSIYQKRKMTSTLQVDMEELKRQSRMEVLGDLRPILEAKGIQFPNIGGVMIDEEHRNNFASTVVGGRPQREHWVPASGLVEGHEQPLPSIEPDMIDNLA